MTPMAARSAPLGAWSIPWELSFHGCAAIAPLALYRVKVGSRDRLSEENPHTAEALAQRGSEVLTGRR